MESQAADIIKVLIVDDSQVSQTLHRQIISTDRGFQIVGVAFNGREAVELTRKFQPDVISMDLNMPFMDGMEATREIMQTNPVPIVVVSSFYEPAEAGLAMEVLEAGAVTIMPKPFGPGHPEYNHTARKYLMTLKSMSGVKVVRRRPNLSNKKRIEGNSPLSSGLTFQADDYRLLVIGASAGGPESTKAILSELNKNFPIPIMLVQHVDRKFIEGYRLWLQSYTDMPVILARDNQGLLPGHVYLAPADKHLVLKGEGVAGLTDEAPVKGHRPSVGYLFRSAGEIYRNRVIAVILSGMGKDGVPEMKMLKDLGAITIAQNEASSLVFGMPGEAVRAGAVRKILSSGEIAAFVSNILINKSS